VSSLTYLEKRRLEELFGMASGYVLDFTNWTFEEFVREATGVDIYEEKYDYRSGSKANRLRAFWSLESDADVARLLAALIEVAEFEGLPDPKLVNACKNTVTRLRSTELPNTSVAAKTRGGQAGSEAAPASFRYEVALSFAGEQRRYVEQVATALRSAGVTVFYDRFEDLWGKDLTTELESVYRSGSRYVVIFVSQEYVGKSWTNHERQHALAGRIERHDDSVLPVRCDEATLPGLPTSIGYVSMTELKPAKLAELIVGKLRESGS